jgi:dephospho-CoA kinase
LVEREIVDMPFVVGLTGGIGSGKSAAAQLFAQKGASVVDADAESRALTAPGGGAIEAIRAAFGERYITAAGALDRVRMRERIFEDPAARALLEGILHPRIQDECSREVHAATGPYAILMIPLLIETGDPRHRVHRVAVVDCSEETQVRRVMDRDGLARDAVLRIITAQASRAARLAAADDIIDNDGPLAALLPQVSALHEVYVRAAISTVWPWPPSG